MPLMTLVLNKRNVNVAPDACPFALGAIAGQEDIFREVSSVRVNNELQARIAFGTTVPATAKVIWGTSKGSMINDTGFVSVDQRFHEIYFTGLAENTEYVFQVVAQSNSCDPYGEEITSDYHWFDTCRINFPLAPDFYTMTGHSIVVPAGGRMYKTDITDSGVFPITSSLLSQEFETFVSYLPFRLWVNQRTNKAYYVFQNSSTFTTFVIAEYDFNTDTETTLKTVTDSDGGFAYNSKDDIIYYATTFDLGNPTQKYVRLKSFEVSTPLVETTIYESTIPNFITGMQDMTYARDEGKLYLIYRDLFGSSNDIRQLIGIDPTTIYNQTTIAAEVLYTYNNSSPGTEFRGNLAYGGDDKFYHGAGATTNDIFVTDVDASTNQGFVIAANLGLGAYIGNLFYDRNLDYLYFGQDANSAIWRITSAGTGLEEVARMPRDPFNYSAGND